MTRVPLDRLSAHHRAFIEKQVRASERHQKPRKEKPQGFGEEFDSAYELQYAQYLDARRLRGAIERWWYHPMKFRIGKNATYEPDFLTKSGTHFVVHEVKGSWKAKNARDGRTRLEVSAYLYQFFTWQAVTKGERGEWAFETIHASAAEVEPMK